MLIWTQRLEHLKKHLEIAPHWGTDDQLRASKFYLDVRIPLPLTKAVFTVAYRMIVLLPNVLLPSESRLSGD